MRVTLSRSGGFAGIVPPPVTLDTAALPTGIARQIAQLVASTGFFDLPNRLAAPARQPDRFQFTVRIVNDDDQEHTVICDEEAAPEHFIELVRAVQQAVRK